MIDNIIKTILIFIAIIFVGTIFILAFDFLNDMESAIVYLAAVIGAGCFWIKSDTKK